MSTTTVYIALFVASIFYALGLEYARREFQDVYDDLTWLMVVVGVGYVLIGLRALFAEGDWLRICGAFCVAGTPIVVRSLINVALARRRLADYLESLGGDDDTTAEVATQR